MPIHPLVIHFPIVLAFFAPICATSVTIMIGRKKGFRRWWILVIGAQFLLASSAVLATKTGERDESKVEPFVMEQALESHEEKGETLAIACIVCFLLSLVPLVSPRRHYLRYLVAVCTIVPLWLTITVGHSGAELVYKQGAANAFSGTGSPILPLDDEDD